MNSVINRIIRRLGFEIRRIRVDPHTQCVSLKTEQSRRGNVLLAYIVEPFLLKAGESPSRSHTHHTESLLIAQVFLERGYDVDVIDYRNASFKPGKDYHYFVSARTNFVRLAGRLNEDCIKFAHLDTVHFLFNNAMAYRRLLELQKRRGITSTSIRVIEHNYAVEHADYLTMLGNQFTQSTYSRMGPQPTSIQGFKMGFRKKHDTCIVWLTHRLDDIALEEYIRLEEQCEGSFDSIILYDDSRHDFKPPNCVPNTRFSLFDIAELNRAYQLNRLRNPVTITPGNTVFPLLDFAQKHSYSYYWLVEYDVRYTGSWNDFFTYFEENKSDLLGTTLYRHHFRPSWCWWKTLKAPRFSLLRAKNRIRGLFSIMRISAEGLRIYLKANRKGWKGHYEVCMPTVLHHYRLAIEDIGGDGEFVAEENRNRFYTNTPGVDGLGPGTFVCPPTQPISEVLPDKLYHAVK